MAYAVSNEAKNAKKASPTRTAARLLLEWEIRREGNGSVRQKQLCSGHRQGGRSCYQAASVDKGLVRKPKDPES